MDGSIVLGARQRKRLLEIYRGGRQSPQRGGKVAPIESGPAWRTW